MKRSLSAIIFLLICSIIPAQDYTVPKDYKLVTPEDYNSYEPQVKETINWLLQTPVAKEQTKRKEANAFFLAWLTGSPTVSINVNTDFIMFKSNPELLMIFIAGWTKYSLNSDYSKDVLEGNKAGIETVVEFYKKNKAYLQKDKEVEQFAKLIEKGKLENEIKKKLKL